VIDEPRRILRRVACLLFLGTLSVYVLTAGGSLSSTDATVMFDLTKNLVDGRSIALSGNLLGLEANRGVDGRFYSQYGLGQSLYNIPFYVAGVAIRDAAGLSIGKPDTIPKAVVALGNTLTSAACVTVIWLFAFSLSGAARPALVAALTAAFASPLWPYSKFGFSVPLTTLLLAGAAYLLWVATRSGRTGHALAAGAILGIAWLTRHEIVVVLVPFALFLWLESRKREADPRRGRIQLLALAGAAGAGGLLWALYNFVRFGSVTYVGYTPWLTGEGYLAFLASPLGAILLFCPVAALWLAAAARGPLNAGEKLLLLTPAVAFYLLYGSLHDWMGGRSYGPRYMLPALLLVSPALAPFLRRASRGVRRASLAIVILSAVVQLPGVVVDYSKVSMDRARSVDRMAEQDPTWRWTESPLLLNTGATLLALPANAAYLTGRTPLPAAPSSSGPDDREFSQRFSFSVDFWWAYLVYLGVLPRTAALGLAATLACSALLLLGWAWRLSGVYDVRRPPAAVIS
jgi:hypothetical protein